MIPLLFEEQAKLICDAGAQNSVCLWGLRAVVTGKIHKREFLGAENVL